MTTIDYRNYGDLLTLMKTNPVVKGYSPLQPVAVTFNDNGGLNTPFHYCNGHDYFVTITRSYSDVLDLISYELVFSEFGKFHCESVTAVTITKDSCGIGLHEEFIPCFSQTSHMTNVCKILHAMRAMELPEDRRRQCTELKKLILRMARASCGLDRESEKRHALSVTVTPWYGEYRAFE